MTTPPPPPGGGDNQPYNPSSNNPNPSLGSDSGHAGPPSYGSAPGGGMPPQAPPPASGNAPQGGSDSTKILSFVSMGTGIVGIVLFCCWALPIFPITALITGFIAKNRTKSNPRPDLKKFILIGLITGAIGIVLSIIYWILFATGVFDINTYSDM